MTSVLSDLDPRALDQAATTVCLTAVTAVEPDQLDLPTPCALWSLGELIAHLVAENHGFAANATNPPGSISRGVWRPEMPDATALAEFPASVKEVTAAFAAPEVLDAAVEVREFGVFPGRVAIAMHFVDSLAHAWDVARSIGLPDPMPAELAEAGLALSALIPDDRPVGSPFASVVPVDPAASANERFLGLLGRDPQWGTR